MANETLPGVRHDPGPANGAPTTEPTTETMIDRATRILAGDIGPADYLSVPDDVIAFVDGGEARTGIELLPESRRKMISTLALQHHHAGEEVLVRHTEDGVVVLAVGSEQVMSLLEQLTPTRVAGVKVECPPAAFR